MSENDQNDQKAQSGARVGLGILGFMVGILVLLWLIKILFGY
jgi:hypothetical protein